MEKIIVVRYGELHLKGKNRGFFEKLILADIRTKLQSIPHKLIVSRGRYMIANYEITSENTIIDKLGKVFGLHSLSVAYKCKTQMQDIEHFAIQALKDKYISQGTTFRVQTNRADKTFEHNSVQISKIIGGAILKTYQNLQVDLVNPQITLNIDVREEGHTFIYCDSIPLKGGMPLNSAGKGLVLLSGGIDSPVSAYLTAKRGLNLTALHFHSYPYTNEKARQKVVDLAQKIAEFTNKITLINVKLTQIQEEIRRCCDPTYAVTLLRAIMMKVSCIVATKMDCKCIVNGESLGQVASQTLEGINITDSFANIPVLRPLVAMDKSEIIEKAREISTFNISILPFEDCCTIFLPSHPVIKPKKHKVDQELQKITNLDTLIDQAVSEMELQKILP